MSMQLESMQSASRSVLARRLRLTGHVQGVGFRPFVYRLAHEFELAGTVQNLRGDVEILVQGRGELLERFMQALIERAPPLARPQIRENDSTAMTDRHGFEILESAPTTDAQVFVPPDAFTCDDCLAELHDAHDRRYRYPFVNCTQCGPRYTLMQSSPYDRANTTMSTFPLCPQCLQEYRDPLDRRFHAEPIACPACGPQLWLEQSDVRLYAASALARAIELLRAGSTIAVKGIGGYHLLCDARNQAAVERLRLRKRRPHKPLAVMFPQHGADGVDGIRRDVQLSPDEIELLASPARPIVLARQHSHTTLAPAIAPGLREVGVMLPYSPLHHLLLGDFGGPLVATSANVSGEPVLTEPDDVRARLAFVADAVLHHDRPIARPADDSVMRCLLGRPRTIRLGRGLAPRELKLPWRVREPVLAVGGHLKTTIALAWDQRVVISPHIADMGTARSEHVLAQVIEDLQRLYGIQAVRVVCDTHRGYATTRWAVRSGLPVTHVLHHHAHASAVAGEHEQDAPMLMFAWDGVGLGADGTLWGGETFLGQPGAWQRVASLRPFRPPGGESAGRAPWRSAAAVCWELGHEQFGMELDPLVRSAWRQNLNCPATSSIGRLFDAAAALILNVHETSYEGQGPMLLEAAAGQIGDRLPNCAALPTYRDASGLCRLDWAPLIADMLDSRDTDIVRAARFHATLAATVGSVAEAQREANGVDTIGLTGGVFQNALLTSAVHELLTRKGFRVQLAERVPCNDGGLSYGQLVELAALECCRE